MMEVNNREIATLIWIVIALAWMCADKGRREGLSAVLQAICNPLILLSVGIMLAYVALCTLVLSAFQLWDWVNLKTTLIWCGAFAFVTMMDISRISEDDTFYTQTIRDTLGALAAVLFIVELNSFSIFSELIIVPLTFVLGMCLAFVQIKKEYEDIRWVFESIAGVFFLTLIVFGLRDIWQNPDTFWTWATLREFSVPVLLSILFLPFIYAMSLYTVFERLWIRLSFLWPDKSLRQHARTKAAFAFAGDLDALRRWSRNDPPPLNWSTC